MPGCDHPRLAAVPGAKYCPDCGAPGEVTCRACGQSFPDDGSHAVPQHGSPCAGSGVQFRGSVGA